MAVVLEDLGGMKNWQSRPLCAKICLSLKWMSMTCYRVTQVSRTFSDARYDPTNYFNNPLTVAPYGSGVAASIVSPPTAAVAAVTPLTPAPAPAMSPAAVPVPPPSVLPPAPSPQLPVFAAPSQSLPTQSAFVAPSQTLPIMPALPPPAVAPPTNTVAASVQAPSPSTTAFNTIAVAG